MRTIKPKSVIRLLRANTLSICHLPRLFSITMEPHCSLKAAEHLFKNKGCYHHNANDRFGLNSISQKSLCTVQLMKCRISALYSFCVVSILLIAIYKQSTTKALRALQMTRRASLFILQRCPLATRIVAVRV